VRDFLANKEIVTRAVPAARIALDLGAPLSSNLALLGFLSAFEGEPFGYEVLRQTVTQISPDRFREKNLSVFDAGHQQGQKA
jgi:Pyruvate/2-oxoacid:ferredoxin oxidoreductase gamma subunit